MDTEPPRVIFYSKAVRDLHWALASPHLLTPAAGVPVASDGWCRQLCQESLSWLRELDAQPGPLEEWLQRQRNVRRLGFYFAALLEFWAADVLVQQQIHAGVDGEVAGQLKLAFARRSVEKEARSWAVPRDAVEVVHWESHVKFFAWRGDGANF
ncbi:hypothetical protein EMIHUDRAFT_254320 [Emiliania huxleyi CCMP1516]|uniref:Uncharacterized protein n=2 Tax=Emiliania huxleyi TaxID=2903 RepID=A0A0D3JV46_EMIH1|nr:hypothetical protein EMIHUDRAFT_254320 [Emiliania huxleyi CCMP1516]EOD27381.1 hypothetical protein EMIHUDRAFT_254320 [Emiliania huxleyi CCMP1516]|eukprot:XP_005779810.1 hypothetical protein EMIHUDRAFT_254320 [Emiliania huxleyi CCMP1516]